jgi:dCMP deaminase
MNSKRIGKNDYYLGIALAVSKRSTCLKRHYGCVIVKDDIIIATGYNGSPRGEENCCDRGSCKRHDAMRYSNYEKCDSVHAEQNALIAASRDRLIDSTVYLVCEEPKVNEMTAYEREITWHEDENPIPCGMCMKMLKNAGVKKIINRKGAVYVCDRSAML